MNAEAPPRARPPAERSRGWCDAQSSMSGDLSDLATMLAERINRPVAINDPTMRLLTHTPHHGPVDPVRMQSILHPRGSRVRLGHL